MSMVFPRFFLVYLDFLSGIPYNAIKGRDNMSDLWNKQIMADNIRYYLRLNNITQTEICSALGFKMPTFSDWVNAKTYPRIDKIEMMANYFGISKSDLVERRPAPQAEDGPKEKAHRLLDQIPEDKLRDVMSYMEFLKSKPDME